MENHIFQGIYNLFCDNIAKNKEITEIKSKLQLKLIDNLNDEEKLLLIKFVDACDEENDLLSYESFKQGFRASVMLMFEVLSR